MDTAQENTNNDITVTLFFPKYYRVSMHNGQDFIDFRESTGGTTELYESQVWTQRSAGFGSAMIKKVEETVMSNFIYGFVRLSNHGARHFYEKNGYLEVLIPKMYGNEDAVMVYKSR